MSILAALGGVGGALALIGAIAVLGRGVFRQVAATEANTKAIENLSGLVSETTTLYNGHEVRIAVLEDRITRN